MGLRSRIRSLFSRADAVPMPQPLMPAPPAAMVRRDGASIANLSTGLGTSYDKGAVARPNTALLPLTDEELRALFGHNGVSRRLVELPAERGTRKGWTVPDVPATEDERLHTYERVCDAMTWARLYGGSAVLLVTEDDIPPSFRGQPREWLLQPLDPKRIGKLHAIHAFDAFEAWPLHYSKDLRDPGFRGPLFWQFASDTFYGTVHASRVAWFRGAKRPPSEWQGGWGRANRMPDDSVLQVVWDEIRRLSETAQGGAALAQGIRESILKISDFQAIATGDQADDLNTRISIMQRTLSLLGIAVMGPEDHFETRTHSPSGFDTLMTSAWDMLGAATGWPQVVLRGSTPGGLTTDDQSGREGMRQVISGWQERCRSPIEQIYRTLFASQDGPTGGVVPSEWSLEYAPLDEPSAQEVADLRKSVAEMDVAMIGAGVYQPSDVARSRFQEAWSLEMLPVEIPDEDELLEAKMEGARLAMEAAEQAPEEDAEGEEPEVPPSDEEELQEDGYRADAGDGTVVVVPAAEPPPELVRQVEQAIGQPLRRPSNPSHITVLYLGEGLPDEAVSEVVGAVQAEAMEVVPTSLRLPAMRAFPHGPDGTPVVVELEDAYGLSYLNERLLRRLAHVVTARQHRRYRAHLTLGYAAEPLSAEALTKLSELKAGELVVPVVVLEVRTAGGPVAQVQVGG